MINDNNSVLNEDLLYIAEECKIFMDDLTHKSFFITGATGLVGSMLVRTLLCLNSEYNTECEIYILIRSLEKAKKIYQDLILDPHIHILSGDIQQSYKDYIDDSLKIDYIIHAASITTSKVMIQQPVDTALVSLLGSIQMLELAKEKKVKSIVFISSMEMYGDVSNYSGLIHEDNIGVLDPLIVRNNYPESKRMIENLCVDYLSQFGVRVKIARLAQTFGPGMLDGETRIFAQFARSVINNQDIVLHTLGKSYGNYCYLADTIVGIMFILFKGNNGEAYNIANEECHMTISEMAEMVCHCIAQDKIKIYYDIPDNNIYGYAKDSQLFLSSEKLCSLGWTPTFSLENAYNRLIKYIKEN